MSHRPPPSSFSSIPRRTRKLLRRLIVMGVIVIGLVYAIAAPSAINKIEQAAQNDAANYMYILFASQAAYIQRHSRLTQNLEELESGWQTDYGPYTFDYAFEKEEFFFIQARPQRPTPLPGWIKDSSLYAAVREVYGGLYYDTATPGNSLVAYVICRRGDRAEAVPRKPQPQLVPLIEEDKTITESALCPAGFYARGEDRQVIRDSEL